MTDNSRKLNNRGASVIEMIIIIAILAVMLSGSIIAFSVLNSSSLKQATRSTKNMLEKTRTNTMSMVADEWSFVLENKDEKITAYIYKVYTDESGSTVTEVVQKEEFSVRVNMSMISDGADVEILDGEKVKVTFVPASGGVNEVVVAGTKYTPTENMITFKFVSGKKKNTVDLFFVSGKVEIE